MPMIYVKPALGGRVRMPERNYEPMGAAGTWVPRTDYYNRLLIGGDIVETDPPAPSTTKPEAASSNAPPRASQSAAPSKEK